MLFDGPHFQATDEGELVFLTSDGDASRRPTEHEILEPEEEHSTLHQNYYLRIPLEHADSQRWREQIAKYLAPLVLGGTYNLSLPRSPIHASKKKKKVCGGNPLAYGHIISAFLTFNFNSFAFTFPAIQPKPVRDCDRAAYTHVTLSIRAPK